MLSSRMRTASRQCPHRHVSQISHSGHGAFMLEPFPPFFYRCAHIVCAFFWMASPAGLIDQCTSDQDVQGGVEA
jgi:hypothetical protein